MKVKQALLLLSVTSCASSTECATTYQADQYTYDAVAAVVGTCVSLEEGVPVYQGYRCADHNSHIELPPQGKQECFTLILK